jgi:hypothetical protein
MPKILSLIIIPLLLFVTLERDNISLILVAYLKDSRYYIWQEVAIQNYNEAILLTEKGQYLEAKSLLQPILNTKDLHNPSDVYELYGDLVYSTSGNTGDTAVFYRRALEYRTSSRIEDKLRLLEINPPTQRQEPSLTQSWDAIAQPELDWLRSSRREELDSLQVSEADALDLYGSLQEPADIISRTLDVLSTGSTIVRDW